MKNIIKYIRIIGFAFVFSVMTSCGSDWLDINKDPNNPTEASSDLLLTNAELNIVNSMGLSTGGLSSHLGVFMHQVTRRGDPDQYGTSGSNFMIGTAWDGLFTNAFEDLRVMIAQSEESGDMIYAGMGKILKAYAYSIMIDVWGDLPFDEANQLPEIRFPTYENGQDVYPKIFALIDEGIGDMTNSEAQNTNTPGADDLFYGGSIDLWTKFANTLKLKLYNQVRLSPNAGDYNIIDNVRSLLQDELISDMSEDFELWYGVTQTPDNRHPAFIADYAGGQKTYYISIWFYQTLTGQNVNVLNGISDPRMPYYFFNQLAGGDAQNPEEFREGDFLSIHFGSTHPNQAQAQDQSQTMLGLYPCGGRFDDGQGGVVSQTSAAGDVSERLLTYYSRLFIEAELSLAGIATGDARQLLEEAIRASFSKVNQAVLNTAGSATAPQSIPTIGQTDEDDYVAAVLAEYDAANNDDRRLEVILTQ